MITKQQLQKILRDFEENSHQINFLCVASMEFHVLWGNTDFQTLCQNKAEEFLRLHDYPDCYTYDSKLLFWRKLGSKINHRDIRIDFLNWWINNFDQQNNEDHT